MARLSQKHADQLCIKVPEDCCISASRLGVGTDCLKPTSLLTCCRCRAAKAPRACCCQAGRERNPQTSHAKCPAGRCQPSASIIPDSCWVHWTGLGQVLTLGKKGEHAIEEVFMFSHRDGRASASFVTLRHPRALLVGCRGPY